jgi:hypothetical protein
MEYPPGYRSFLVRLWREEGATGHEQWCGEVEQIQSGRRRRFTSFDDLMTLLRPGTSPGPWLTPDGAPEGDA